MRKPILSWLLLLGLLSCHCCRSNEKSEKAVPAVAFVKSAQVFAPNRSFQAGLVDLDVVLPNRGPVHSQVLINDGKGYFADPGQKLARQTHGMGIADWDNDGDSDIVFVCAGYRENDVIINLPTKVYLNDGRGWFTESGVTLPKNSILGDLDGDGDHDAFAKIDGKGYGTLLNDGAGNFSQHWTGKDNQAIAKVRGMDITLGDLDGDGDLDAFVTNGDREKSYPASVWLNDGTGRFTDSGLRFQTDGETRGCSLGDLDGDGDLDIFVANFYNGCNEVWFNTLKKH